MSEAEPSPDPKPAPRLGSYLLSKQLGSGGMSNVFRAVHEETGNVVAVKVLPRSLAKNVTLLQRFLREAKSAEALDHPNIVAIYDRGFDQGRHYLVLEYVEGRDLHDRVRLNGPLEPTEAVRFIREVAEGLRYASSQGMIHRDVKPANLLMTPEGHAKIIDLGLALQTVDEDERVTRDGTTVGTVDYMAPEQARDSRQTSERSDIYSLGCTFYYLLTGSQPYPGGGLADKLARHYKAPIPDVRATRPEVSEALSLLIRRMMEKKPERRFADYNQLIDALDAVSNTSSPGSRPPAILDAVIVDDEDDEAIGLVPTESSVTPSRGRGGERPPSTRDYMMAEIVDDDDDEDLSSLSSSRPRTTPVRPEPSSTAEISLADLAALDSDGEVSSRRSGRRLAIPSPAPSTPRLPVPALDDLEDDEPVEGVAAGVRRSSGPELSLKTWIAAGVMVGLVIAIVGFGVSMVISIAKPKPPEVVTNPEREPVAEPSPTLVVPRPRTTNAGPVRPPAKPKDPVAQPTPPVVTVTPTGPAKEIDYSKSWEDRLFPSSLSRGAPATERPPVVVRRLLEAGEETQFSSLAAAFSRAGDVVEIADTGPFFEDDLQVAGKSRLIRARPGLRPIIQVAATTLQNVKDQEAKFVLGGPKVESLTLEGIDLAVDVRDLPEQQSTLFLCRGAEITLRDCSITLVNVGDRKVARFSVFRVEEGSRPSRVVLERSTIRGPIRTLVDLAALRAEVVLDRSLVIGEAGPLLVLEPADRPDRKLYFHRSLVANRGPILEFTAKSTPIPIRALGSTFARIEGGNGPGMMNAKSAFAGEPRSAIDWSGEDNAFVGWPAWLISGPEGTVRVTGLAGVKTAWSGSDGSSRESPGPWPPLIARDDVDPEDIASLVPDRRGTLARIAYPHPSLREMTYGSMSRLPTPELSETLIPPYIAPPPIVQAPHPPPRPAVVKNPTGPTPRVPRPEIARPIGPVEQTFDVSEPPWSGDLGLFLAEKIVAGTTRATIWVRGGGIHPSSPIRFPDGLSIAILGESAEGLNLPMPTFVPKAGAVGLSMFELRGGDLALANLGFSTEGAVRPRHWVRVEDGLLAIKHCRFRDPGGAAPGVGPMIAFVAAGGTPITPRIGPLKAETNRPTARLKNTAIWTVGDAISAELGRGVVDLENCLILSGGPSIALLPRKVERDRFEADLVLERCTIANDRTGVYLGPWPGDPLGPDRPWLVSTRSCAFPRTQVGTTGAMLLADPDAMSRGVLFWQSYQDRYEVSRFVASAGVQPPNPPPADYKKGWVDFWGSKHARSVLGPDPGRPSVVIRYRDKDRPKPGRVTPGSLELDPKSHKDLGVDLKELPPFPKG